MLPTPFNSSNPLVPSSLSASLSSSSSSASSSSTSSLSSSQSPLPSAAHPPADSDSADLAHSSSPTLTPSSALQLKRQLVQQFPALPKSSTILSHSPSASPRVSVPSHPASVSSNDEDSTMAEFSQLPSSYLGQDPFAGSSLSNTSSPEIGSPSALFKCLWEVSPGRFCNEMYSDPQHFYEHLTEFHVGRKKSQNLTLNCMWVGCSHGSKPFAKRDHIVSHCRAHVAFKANACPKCKSTFKWPHDLKKHGLKTGHFSVVDMPSQQSSRLNVHHDVAPYESQHHDSRPSRSTRSLSRTRHSKDKQPAWARSAPTGTEVTPSIMVTPAFDMGNETIHLSLDRGLQKGKSGDKTPSPASSIGSEDSIDWKKFSDPFEAEYLASLYNATARPLSTGQPEMPPYLFPELTTSSLGRHSSHSRSDSGSMPIMSSSPLLDLNSHFDSWRRPPSSISSDHSGEDLAKFSPTGSSYGSVTGSNPDVGLMDSTLALAQLMVGSPHGGSPNIDRSLQLQLFLQEQQQLHQGLPLSPYSSRHGSVASSSSGFFSAEDLLEPKIEATTAEIAARMLNGPDFTASLLAGISAAPTSPSISGFPIFQPVNQSGIMSPIPGTPLGQAHESFQSALAAAMQMSTVQDSLPNSEDDAVEVIPEEHMKSLDFDSSEVPNFGRR